MPRPIRDCIRIDPCRLAIVAVSFADPVLFFWRTNLIYVLAVITAKSGQREQILDAFHANSPTVRAEAGCIEYRAAVDAENALPMQTPYGEDTFVVVEKWQDMESLRAHAAAPHMAAYSAATKGWVANRTIHILSPVPAES